MFGDARCSLYHLLPSRDRCCSSEQHNENCVNEYLSAFHQLILFLFWVQDNRRTYKQKINTALEYLPNTWNLDETFRVFTYVKFTIKGGDVDAMNVRICMDLLHFIMMRLYDFYYPNLFCKQGE